MNFPTYTTDTLFMDAYQASSVFQMFIHTICFHRMIYKLVKPKELAHPIYDSIYYVMIDDPMFHKTVTEKLEYIIDTVKERPSGTISVIFYHIKPSTGWFSKDDKVEMERWNIPFQWYEPYDKSHTHAMKETHIQSIYLSLLEKLSSVPAPIYQVINSYLPFDIIDSNKSNSFKDILQFITSGPPKLNLF
jgi:hypothetical protein